MYLGISLHLAMNEKNDKMKWVHKFFQMREDHSTSFQAVSSILFLTALKAFTEVSTTSHRLVNQAAVWDFTSVR